MRPMAMRPLKGQDAAVRICERGETTRCLLRTVGGMHARMSSETKPEPHVHGPDCNHERAPVAEQAKRIACPGRNEPCWCDSGKKYKKCHLRADELC